MSKPLARKTIHKAAVAAFVFFLASSCGSDSDDEATTTTTDESAATTETTSSNSTQTEASSSDTKTETSSATPPSSSNTSAQKNSNRETLFIHPEQVDCEGVAPQKCLQVKKSLDDDWELFYDNIEGFTFQQGVLQEIIVETTEIENPPADASSTKYKLVETISTAVE